MYAYQGTVLHCGGFNTVIRSRIGPRNLLLQTGVLNLKMKNSGAEEKKILNQIQLNARKLYSDTKDFIWTINPESNILPIIKYSIRKKNTTNAIK